MNSDLALCRAWLSICWEARQSIQCYSSAALGSGRRAVVLSLLDWSRTRALQHDDTHPINLRTSETCSFPATGSFCSCLGFESVHVCRCQLARALCITIMTTSLATVALWLRKRPVSCR